MPATAAKIPKINSKSFMTTCQKLIAMRREGSPAIIDKALGLLQAPSKDKPLVRILSQTPRRRSGSAWFRPPTGRGAHCGEHRASQKSWAIHWREAERLNHEVWVGGVIEPRGPLCGFGPPRVYVIRRSLMTR